MGYLKKNTTAEEQGRQLSRFVFPGCCGIDVIKGFPRSSYREGGKFPDKLVNLVSKELDEILNGEHKDYYYSDQEMYGSDSFFRIRDNIPVMVVLSEYQIKQFEPVLLERGFVKMASARGRELECTWYVRNVEKSGLKTFFSSDIKK